MNEWIIRPLLWLCKVIRTDAWLDALRTILHANHMGCSGSKRVAVLGATCLHEERISQIIPSYSLLKQDGNLKFAKADRRDHLRI